MKTIDGDLIVLAKQGEFDAIAHGCNCFNTMGAGIARQIAREFPAAKLADFRTKKGDRAKLGTITAVGSGYDAPINRHLDVVNCYTQYDVASQAGEDVLDYEAVEKCMAELAVRYKGRCIGLPKIGSGLAGGDWERIKGIIERVLDPHAEVVIVNFVAGR